MLLIIGFAALFNFALIPGLPNLSDDMYRYIWDGRMQANGINPYRYPSDAPETARLRDPEIWERMNRKSAVTVYPPGAQILFAAIWRLLPDNVTGFKLICVAFVFAAGLLLVPVLRRWGIDATRVLIFLWNPLLIVEVAHAAHVDAFFLPVIIGALLLRLMAPVDRPSPRHEAAIGVLIGIAALIKLFPILLIVPLWSVRRVRWRAGLLLPTCAVVTVALGYALYIAPGVDTLGFLPNYSREFFNIGPVPQQIVNWAIDHRIAYYTPITALLLVSLLLVSFYFILFPAATPQIAIQRCIWPIGLTILITLNLFSWYVLWTLPFIALEFDFSVFKPSFGWWLFSGLIVMSYHLFITGYAQPWVAWVEFSPLYLILILAAVVTIGRRLLKIRSRNLLLTN
jgi:hypothetical protein